MPTLGIPLAHADPTVNLYNQAAALSVYKIQKEEQRTKEALFKKQLTLFSKIIDFIYNTVSAYNQVFFEKVEVYPWDYLRALKVRLAPTDSARIISIEDKYNEVKVGLK